VIQRLFGLHLVLLAGAAAGAMSFLWFGQVSWPSVGVAAIDTLLLNFWIGIRRWPRIERDLSRFALGIFSLSLFAAVRLGWFLIVLRLGFQTLGRFRRGPVLILSTLAYPIAVAHAIPPVQRLLVMACFVAPLGFALEFARELLLGVSAVAVLAGYFAGALSAAELSLLAVPVALFFWPRPARVSRE
jgi:hypothetical protein